MTLFLKSVNGQALPNAGDFIHDPLNGLLRIVRTERRDDAPGTILVDAERAEGDPVEGVEDKAIACDIYEYEEGVHP